MFWGLLVASLAVRLYAVFVSPLEPALMKPNTGCGDRPRSWVITQTTSHSLDFSRTSSVFDHQNFGQLLGLRISALIHTLTALFYGKLAGCYFQIILDDLPRFMG